MKLILPFEFKNDHILKDLEIESYLDIFSHKTDFFPHEILNQFSVDEGLAHYKSLIELDTFVKNSDINFIHLIEIIECIPSLDSIINDFKNGQMNSPHSFLIHQFIENSVKFLGIEKADHCKNEIDLLEAIDSILISYFGNKCEQLLPSPTMLTYLDSMEKINELINEIIIKTEIEVFNITGIRLIYSYPKELKCENEYLNILMQCPHLKITSQLDNFFLLEILFPDKKLLTKKEFLEKNISIESNLILNTLNYDLKPKVEEFCNFYSNFKKKIFKYFLLHKKRTLGYIFPDFTESVEIHLKDLTIPIVSASTTEPYVPLTISLSKGSNILMGANMSGKSTILKSIYFVLKLIKLGLPVPAKEIILNFPNKIKLFLKNSGELTKNLSSFASELDFFSFEPVQNDFILIDEIFSSTNPSSGLTLATLFVRDYNQRDIIMLCTTFYIELAHEKNISVFEMVEIISTIKNSIKNTYLPRLLTDPLSLNRKIDYNGPLRLALKYPIPENIKDFINKIIS